MTENEVFEHISNLAGDYKCFNERITHQESLILYNLIDEIQQYRAIGTIDEFKQAMNFKKYFMELYGEGLEVTNWHKNGDLEPLVNFIDEACN